MVRDLVTAAFRGYPIEAAAHVTGDYRLQVVWEAPYRLTPRCCCRGFC